MSAPKYAGEILYAGERPVISSCSLATMPTSTSSVSRNGLRLQLRQCLKRFPDGCAEGVIDFDGVTHFFTYEVKAGYIEAYTGPRDVVEPELNIEGLSTYELFE